MNKVEFDWDEPNAPNGNSQHIARHGVATWEVEQAFSDPYALAQPGAIVGLEERVALVGASTEGRVLFVAYVIREGRIRPITAYPASPRLRRLYYVEKGEQ